MIKNPVNIPWKVVALAVAIFVSSGTTNAEPDVRSKVAGYVFERAADLQFERRDVAVFPLNQQISLLTTLDANGDGLTDVLGISDASGELRLAINSESGVFAVRTVTGIGTNTVPWLLVPADLNNDGKDDLFGLKKDGVGFFRAFSDGTGGFVEESLQVQSASYMPSQILLGDFTCDGKPDVALRGYDGSAYFVKVYAETVEGRFTETATIVHNSITMYAGSVLAPGCKSLIISNETESLLVQILYPLSRSLAQFPAKHPAKILLIADFSGDGYDDVVAYTPEELSKWWMGLSNGRTALERPVTGFTDAAFAGSKPLVGDFNGDGTADILFRREPEGIWSIYSSKRGAALAHVRIRSDSGQETETNDIGMFTLSDLPSGARMLTATAENREFIRPSRQIVLPGRSSSAFNFVALHREADAVQRGQVERYGPEPKGPFVCFGYNPGSVSGKWGKIGMCPAQYSAFDASDVGAKTPDPQYYPMSPGCCKLPSDDILTAESVWVDEQCPDDFIVTGSQSPGVCKTCRTQMRCTKINTQRYQLGPVTEGVYWGVGHSSSQNKGTMHKDAIPAPMRVSVGRESYNTFDLDGCIGNPPGSQLVRKGPTGCPGLHFRELQYLGSPNDPPKGTPVRMYADCKRIDNPFEPTAGCKE